MKRGDTPVAAGPAPGRSQAGPHPPGGSPSVRAWRGAHIKRGRTAVIGIPYLWLLVFFMLPFLIVLKISVSEMDGVKFNDVLSFVDGQLKLSVKFGNYAFLAQDDLYFKTYLSSLGYAAATTVFCLLIGYPFAYFLARAEAHI